MKRQNLALLIVVGAAALYAIYSYFTGSGLAVTIDITDEGFRPETITVLKGTTVKWVNTGDRPHWPASNFHPLHNLYPEKGGCLGSAFDACRGLEKGESFSFKLDETGEWPMHDHLYPGFTMVVEVVEKGSDAERLAVSFDLKSMTPEKFRSWEYGTQLAFIKEFAGSDPASAWEFLKKGFMVDGKVVGNAHELSHIIGNELYKQEGLKGIKACDITFAFGCMHGVTEAMLVKEGPEKIKSIEEECLLYFPADINTDYTGCIHGMGHGIYTFTGGNLGQSLAYCDVLSAQYRTYCHDGVLMENSSNPANIVFDPKNPWKLCADLKAEYHQPCAKYQSQIFLHAPGDKTIENVGKNCALGPSTVLKETCFQSLGYFVSQTNLGVVDKILNECRKVVDEEGESICIRGGAIETIFQRYGDWKASANALCGSLEGQRATLCFKSIEVMIKKNEL